MKGTPFRILATVAVLFAVGACADSTSSTSPSLASQELSAAFLSTPAGFSSTDNTFAPTSDIGQAWMPDRNGHDDDSHMMGGGLRPEFFGGVAFGRGWDHGPFGFGLLLANCTLSSTTGRVTCPDVTTRRGLTISRSFAFKDASGAAQSSPNASTNSINAQVVVSGTITRDDDDGVTSKIAHSSDRTVTGLAAGATQRTVDGGSKGTEETTGKTEDGVSFTASRLVADTVKGLVIPLQEGRPTFPTAGTITRLMQATITLSGKAPVTRSRMEVVTFKNDGTATVVITKNGTTKNCTLSAATGLKCS
ncbi:MAG TPA: hypothetical protein VFD67_02805 [Gemmatimonadaceae bacterium]|nr:hypothetical protein [Gemmatimonadaceae bacterium]